MVGVTRWSTWKDYERDAGYRDPEERGGSSSPGTFARSITVLLLSDKEVTKVQLFPCGPFTKSRSLGLRGSMVAGVPNEDQEFVQG